MSENEKSVRRWVRKLCAAGKYEQAKRIVEQDHLRRQAAVSTAARQLENEGEIQWNALQEAKAKCLSDEQYANSLEERAHIERLLREQAARCQADEVELSRFATSEAAKLSTMPIAVPHEVLVLRQQEKQVMLDGRFDTAEQRRRDATLMEKKMLGATLSSRGELLEQRVMRRAKTILTREKVAQEKNEASLSALGAKHNAQHIKTVHQLHNIEEALLADQRRAHHTIQEMHLINEGPCATHARAQRGTALRKRVFGDSHRLPSLCELYGPLLS